MLSSIRLRLLGLVLLAIIPVLALTLANGVRQREAGLAQARRDAEQSTSQLSYHYARWLTVVQPLLVGLASAPALQAGDAAACRAFLDSDLAPVLRNFDNEVTLGVVDQRGVIWCSPTHTLESTSVAGDSWYLLARQTGAFSIGARAPDLVTTAAPITTADGGPSGYIFLAFPLSYIERTLQRPALPPGAVMSIFDRDGAVLLSSEGGPRAGSRLDTARLVPASGASGHGVAAIEPTALDGAPRVLSVLPLTDLAPTCLSLAVGIPEAVAHASANRALLANLIGLGIVALFASAAALVGGEVFFLRPIYGLLATTRQIAAGDLGARTWVARGNCELGQLGRAFNDMAVSLQEHEARITHQALHDALTGLPNRALFLDRLERALVGIHRHGQPIGVMFLDLDNFKVINDSLGHTQGDRLLQVVAERLTACVRPADTVARLGGDEFTVLIERIEGDRHAIEIAERIEQALRQPFDLDGFRAAPSVSIGIAIAASGHTAADALLRDADLAMYAAKGAGKSCARLFTPSMNEAAMTRLRLEGDLRRALDQGEFRLLYQPIVELETGVMREVEALVRWQHPERGLITPSEFIPVAEETGLIVPIGQWILAEACRQAKRWQAAPARLPLVIGVNLSPRQFSDPALADDVRRALAENDLPPTALKLEITESTAMEDGEASIRTLHELRAIGVRLAIDDFGTGYSSLSYLKRFPVDTLKVDRSFIDGLGEDANDTAIVGSVVALAKSLGLDVTGEGVETTMQLEELRSLGCDRGQGYLLARPLAPEQVAALLDTPADRAA